MQGQGYLQAKQPDRSDRTITLSREVYEELATQAAAYREFAGHLWKRIPTLARLAESPHVRDLISEWIEWDDRRQTVESSHAISAAGDWEAVAAAPTYAELERRRSVPGPLHQERLETRGEYRGGPVDWHTGHPRTETTATAA